MKFILNRDYELVSRLGASVNIKKNEPFFAPAFLRREIENLGGEVLEEDGAGTGTEDSTTDKTPGTPEERKAALLAAFEIIMTSGVKADMTEGGKGHPTQKALQREMGWTPVAAERDAAWAEYVKGKKS